MVTREMCGVVGTTKGRVGTLAPQAEEIKVKSLGGGRGGQKEKSSWLPRKFCEDGGKIRRRRSTCGVVSIVRPAGMGQKGKYDLQKGEQPWK